jgi:hypothetical protein
MDNTMLIMLETEEMILAGPVNLEILELLGRCISEVKLKPLRKLLLNGLILPWNLKSLY